ncbi:MAG: formyltetrahydrofolate hydrolase [Arenicella sp.]|jgi:formyltetrahydrofolate hydrolase
MLEVITKILGVLLVAVIVVLVLKWESAKRLYDVTTLFDEHKIVANFSGMKEICNSVEIQSLTILLTKHKHCLNNFNIKIIR